MELKKRVRVSMDEAESFSLALSCSFFSLPPPPPPPPFLSQATSPFGSFKLESFRSFKHLKGSKKGDKMEGIQKSAIKVFQTFYHLNPTEILDILETLVRDESHATLRVSFQFKDKGARPPFDGPGGIVGSNHDAG
ncbi:hypothetical protein CK203_072770 [Vitis vinifera]|uniref:Uncharacterized protein n=1 Tax=Vitis vinifera TaxID=29760 RepID=A0A438DM60_VITVI|nr:hypothetical protein CK203_072770 [Vitis vinifera]